MDEVHPWERYQKDRLPSGLAYPAGRDSIESALTAASARVGALYFSVPELNPLNYPPTVIRIHWPGSGRSGYFDAKDGNARPLLIMWINAVPSGNRAVIRECLEAGALSRACGWIAELMSDPESPLLYSERELYLTWTGSALAESPTWPPHTSTDPLPWKSVHRDVIPGVDPAVRSG